MNITLWILQALLAAAFAAHGWMLVSPPPELLPIMNEQLGVGFRLFLGVAEIAGAIGLLLPAMSRRMPWLTPVAAACLAFVVASATVLHLSRAETSSAVTTAILLLLAAFVAYGRWRVRPIASRSRGRSAGRTLEPGTKSTGAILTLLLATAASAQAQTATIGYAPVNGLRMYYEIHVNGDGEPLVLLHGSFMTIPNNRAGWIEDLAKSRRVIAVEMQGHGRTADIDRAMDLKPYDFGADALRATRAPFLFVPGDADGVRLDHIAEMVPSQGRRDLRRHAAAVGVAAGRSANTTHVSLMERREAIIPMANEFLDATSR